MDMERQSNKKSHFLLLEKGESKHLEIQSYKKF